MIHKISQASRPEDTKTFNEMKASLARKTSGNKFYSPISGIFCLFYCAV